MSARFEKIDDLVYRLERAIVVASLVVMSVVVFLDVVHRTFAGEGNVFVGALVKIFGVLGRQVDPGTPTHDSLETAAPVVLWVAFVWLVYFGIRTATRDAPVAPARALLYAVLGVVAIHGLIRGLIVMMPNGFIWSQPLSLVLTLWVGFIGASMCTHDNRHLKVEAVRRHLPAATRRYVDFASAVLTTFFTLALMWLSLRYVIFNYDEYVATQGQGALLIGLDAPKYLCFGALPVAFALMSIRFGARSVLALRGQLEDRDPLHGLLDDDARTRAPAPSDVPTEVGLAVAGEDAAVPEGEIRAVADGRPVPGAAGEIRSADDEEGG